MPIATSPFLLKDASLTLIAKADAGTGTPVEYSCQLNQAQLTPAEGGGGTQTYETFCDTHTSSGSTSTWTLDLGGFQAFEDATDLSTLLFDEEGEIFSYVLTPKGGTVSATNPGFKGDVTLKPVAVGGTAGTFATFTISLPCTAKPTKITTAGALAEATAKTTSKNAEKVA